MRRILLTAAAVTAFSLGVSAAHAATILDFGAAPGAVNPIGGYSPSYTPNTLTFGSVSVTGWRYSSGSVTQAHVANLVDDGLAVLAPGENGNLNGNGEYHIDNLNGVDFVLIDFGQLVRLSRIDTISFGIGSSNKSFDQDFSYGDYNPGSETLLAAITGGLTNVGYTPPSASGWPARSNPGWVSVNATGYSRYWLIGASMTPDTDGRYGPDSTDGFKLTRIKYETPPPTAVPEPGTWAMMLAGFGVVGYAMRRRRPMSRRPAAA